VAMKILKNILTSQPQYIGPKLNTASCSTLWGIRKCIGKRCTTYRASSISDIAVFSGVVSSFAKAEYGWSPSRKIDANTNPAENTSILGSMAFEIGLCTRTSGADQSVETALGRMALES